MSRPTPIPRLRRAALLSLVSPCLVGGLGAQESGSTPQEELRERVLPAGERVLKLTLGDAVRIALAQNLELDAEKIATEIARFDVLGSWGAFDPLLSVSASLEDSEQQGRSQISGGNVVETDTQGLNGSLVIPLTTGGTGSVSYGRANTETTNQLSNFDTSTVDVFTVSFTQPLLRGAWSRYATSTQRQDEIALRQQVAREEQIRADLIRDVISAYWDLNSAIQEVRVRQLAVERGQKQLEQDKRRLELGAGTEVDVLQAETTLAQQEEALLNAEFLLQQAEDTLRRRVFQSSRKLIEGEEDAQEAYLQGWDYPIEPLTDLPALQEVDLDWRTSFDRAIAQRPELVQSRLDIDAADVSYDFSYSNYLPQLDLNLSSSSAGFDSNPSDAFDIAIGWDFPTHAASLDFSLPIRNRSAKFALRAAEAAIRQAQLNYDRVELDILAEVRAAVRDVVYRFEAVQAAAKSAALAKRQEEAEQLRLEIGLSTTFQVLEFQETLAEANSALVAARAAYAKALVALAHAEGRLDQEYESGS